MAGVQDFDRTPLLLSKTQRYLYLLPQMAGSGHQSDISGLPWTLSTAQCRTRTCDLSRVKAATGNPATRAKKPKARSMLVEGYGSRRLMTVSDGRLWCGCGATDGTLELARRRAEPL